MQIAARHKFIEEAEKLLAEERRLFECVAAAVAGKPITWDEYRILGTAKTGFTLKQFGRLE